MRQADLEKVKQLTHKNYETWGQWVIETMTDKELVEELTDYETLEEWVKVKKICAQCYEEILFLGKTNENSYRS